MLIPGFQAGLQKAYEKVRVDPDKYMLQLQRAHRLPITSWDDMFQFSGDDLRPHAQRIISGSARAAALEGAGLGLGGFATLAPDMGILSAITIRLLQKLSLLYGFEYATDNETVELWIAAASAAGLELGRDFLEKQTVQHLVPRVIDLIAVRLSEEVVEKWAGRLIPVLSAGAGAALNYYFVRAWGRRAQKHFEARHRAVRRDEFTLEPPPISNALPGWTM
jgi:EcsC protein family